MTVNLQNTLCPQILDACIMTSWAKWQQDNTEWLVNTVCPYFSISNISSVTQEWEASDSGLCGLIEFSMKLHRGHVKQRAILSCLVMNTAIIITLLSLINKGSNSLKIKQQFISVILQKYVSNVCWFQLLQRDDLLFFPVLHHQMHFHPPFYLLFSIVHKKDLSSNTKMKKKCSKISFLMLSWKCDRNRLSLIINIICHSSFNSTEETKTSALCGVMQRFLKRSYN